MHSPVPPSKVKTSLTTLSCNFFEFYEFGTNIWRLNFHDIFESSDFRFARLNLNMNATEMGSKVAFKCA